MVWSLNHMHIFTCIFCLYYIILSCIVVHGEAHSNQKYILGIRQPKVIPTWNLSLEFLQELANISNAPVFVETGSLIGDTTHNASLCFQEVYTIELVPQLYQKVQERFKNTNHVHCYFGDSPVILKEILPKIKERIICYLDAHPSGGITATTGGPTNVLRELSAIKEVGIKDAIIIIDDIRGFDSYPISQIRKAIFEINSSYHFAIFGDQAITYLPQELFTVSPLVQACTISRLYGHIDNITFEQLIEAEKIIGQAKSPEREAIIELSQIHKAGGFYQFWEGLIHLEERDYEKGIQLFEEALNAPWRFLDSQRISLYLEQIKEIRKPCF